MPSALTRFYNKVQVQRAVYWGKPISDGYGTYNHSARVIKCRWDDRQDLIRTFNGEEVTSSARLMVQDDLEFGGRVKLLDHTIDDEDDPNGAKFWEKQMKNNHDGSKFTNPVGGVDLNDSNNFGCVLPLLGKQKNPLFKKNKEFVRIAFV